MIRNIFFLFPIKLWKFLKHFQILAPKMWNFWGCLFKKLNKSLDVVFGSAKLRFPKTCQSINSVKFQSHLEHVGKVHIFVHVINSLPQIKKWRCFVLQFSIVTEIFLCSVNTPYCHWPTLSPRYHVYRYTSTVNVKFTELYPLRPFKLKESLKIFWYSSESINYNKLAKLEYYSSIIRGILQGH